MTIPVRKIVTEEFLPAFRALAAIPFPAMAVNRAIAKSLSQITEARAAYQLTHVALLNKHGKLVEGSATQYQLNPEQARAFQKDIEDVLAELVEIAIEKPLTLPPSATLTGLQLHELAGLIED